MCKNLQKEGDGILWDSFEDKNILSQVDFHRSIHNMVNGDYANLLIMSANTKAVVKQCGTKLIVDEIEKIK